MIRANRENREWENEAWDKQADKAGESREQAQEDPIQKRENGQTDITGKNGNHIELISIIGEIEGHENLSGNTKTTKYEHILPKLAEIEESGETEGVLVLINTVGGDVSCGLALAEMIASLSKPTVSLVIGDSHSIGVPLAVSADYSFIVPSATMVLHPVRTNGMFIGVMQTYLNMEKTQDRITGFIAAHSDISQKRLEELMLDTSMLVKDVGTMLEGEDAVREGLINEIGGIRDALNKLKELMDQKTSSLQAEKQKVVLY